MASRPPLPPFDEQTARQKVQAAEDAVRFQYECHDVSGQWWCSYGNELWGFDENGLMRRREASINDIPITEGERRVFGPRPEAEHGESFPVG